MEMKPETELKMECCEYNPRFLNFYNWEFLVEGNNFFFVIWSKKIMAAITNFIVAGS
jgi:hypothetical protein